MIPWHTQGPNQRTSAAARQRQARLHTQERRCDPSRHLFPFSSSSLPSFLFYLSRSLGQIIPSPFERERTPELVLHGTENKRVQNASARPRPAHSRRIRSVFSPFLFSPPSSVLPSFACWFVSCFLAFSLSFFLSFYLPICVFQALKFLGHQ